MLTDLLLVLSVSFVLTQTAIFTTTIYLHRCLTHRAMTFAAPVAAVFRLLTWLTTGIRPRQWVAVHRKHHVHTDTEEDPHSPVVLGWWVIRAARGVRLAEVRHDDVDALAGRTNRS